MGVSHQQNLFVIYAVFDIKSTYDFFIPYTQLDSTKNLFGGKGGADLWLWSMAAAPSPLELLLCCSELYKCDISVLNLWITFWFLLFYIGSFYNKEKLKREASFVLIIVSYVDVKK